ncbi:MAG: hypothetical protein DSY89_03730 [Deltaproteobacteria bacterium]|nr:MAG: hypothetical protein DSY89_03730 [Deltaproteobacteria bacterium]
MMTYTQQYREPGLGGFRRSLNVWGVAVFLVVMLSGCIPASTKQLAQKTMPATRIVYPDSAYYHFLLAQQDRSAGRLEAAVLQIEKAVKLDPDSGYLKKELAGLWSEQKKNEKALEILKEVIEQDPDDVDALLMASHAQLALNRTDDAVTTLEKVIAKDAGREESYHTLGGIYIGREDYKNALRVYRQLVKEHPESFVGYFFLGKINTNLGRPEAAEKAFQKTLLLAPDLEEPRFRLIELYQSQGQAEKATALYREILTRNPHSVRAAMGLALLNHQQPEAAARLENLGRQSLADKNVISVLIRQYIDTEKYDDAIILTEGMLKGAPDSDTLHYLAGLAYDKKENQAMVLHHFRQVTPQTKFYKYAALQIGFILHEQGKTDEAISQLETLIRQFPEYVEPFLYLGIFHEDLKQYEAALDSLEKGLRVEPENTRLLFREGVIFDKLGNKEKCIQTMREVIRLDPKHANALNYLGYTYADLGKNLPEAEDLIKAAVQLKPEDGYITDSLGWIYYKTGRYAEALKVLLKAGRLIPDDPTILEHIGDAYLKTEGRRKALEYYRRSLKVKKDDTGAIEKKIQDLTGE